MKTHHSEAVKNEAIVTIDNLTKVYRVRTGAAGFKHRSFAAVNGVSLAIPRGKVFGLVGESGSGKTTLARCLLYLDPPTEGRVVFDGIDLGKLSGSELRAIRHRMQIIFQDPNNALNPRISAYRSLSEGLSNRGVRNKIERLKELTELVSIPFENLKRKPRAFSGGQRQRLVIARALSMEPDFLILDEPVSNLDVSIQAQIINLLMDLKDTLSLTYLFISHDLNLVSYVSDFVGVMYSGQLVEMGPVTAVLETPLHGYTRTLLSAAPRVHGSKIDGRVTTAEHANADRTGCAYRHLCPYESGDCSTGIPTLLDVGGGHRVACRHAAGAANRR